MLRHLVARGFRAVNANPKQLTTSLGVAGTRELSGQGCWGQSEITASSPLCSGDANSASAACFSDRNPLSLPLRPAARLEIWRHCSTATLPAGPPRPAVFFASVTPPEANSAAPKAKPAKKASRSGATTTKAKSSPAKRKPTAAKSKPTAAKKVGANSRAKGTARGRAAAERRQAFTADKVKAAREAAKAKAAVHIAKSKAAAEKLKTTTRNLVAKVKADAKEKLRVALEKANAKAAEQIARLEAKAGGRVKRAPSALNVFVREHTKGHPEATLSDACRKFRELSVEQKQKYVELAAAAKAEAQQIRNKLAADRAARRPTTAYTFFIVEQRKVVAAANPGMSSTDVMRRLGEMWRGMGAEERQKYVDLSVADRTAKGLDRQATPAAAAQPAALQPEQRS